MIYCVEDDDNIRELVIYTLETTGLKATEIFAEDKGDTGDHGDCERVGIRQGRRA